MCKIDEVNSPLVETYSQYPFVFERADGMYIWDEEGRKFLDFYGGHAVCVLGHSPREVAQAVSEQAEKFMFYSNLARIPIRERGAERLLEFAASGHEKVFFCNSGGEANENALKIAIKHTGRNKIVGLKGGWHGRTTLAMAATDDPKWVKDYGARFGEVGRIVPNDISQIASEVDDSTAAVILEPIQSIGGVVEMEESYLKALRERCDSVGAFLIFDEVQTGMGRSGEPFVSRAGGLVSDMSTVSKGLGAGFPLGAVLMKKELGLSIEKGELGSTFGGGPMAMAALIANIEVIERNSLVQNAKNFGKYAKESFCLVPGVEAVLGRGCLLGLLMNREAKPLQKELFGKGIILGLCSNPKVLHLLPPLTAGKREVDKLAEALDFGDCEKASCSKRQ